MFYHAFLGLKIIALKSGVLHPDNFKYNKKLILINDH